jgi:hypothetical protein
MATSENKTAGQTQFGLLRKIHDFGNISQIIEGKTDGLRLPFVEKAKVVGMTEDLEVEETNFVAGLASGLGDQFEPERLEAQVNLRIHQRAGMNKENSHDALLQFALGNTGR